MILVDPRHKNAVFCDYVGSQIQSREKKKRKDESFKYC